LNRWKRDRESAPRASNSRYAADARRIWLAVGAAVAVLAAAAGAIAWALSSSDREPSAPRAAIIDQLSATDPNPDFVQSATQQLQAAGYAVDYYEPGKVTVALYRELPKRGYDFILLRSHASESINKIDPATGKFTGEFIESIGLFTNEIYSTDRYVDDQRAGRLMVDSYVDRPIKDNLFGITAPFIASAVHGDFKGATVVLMGCSGLKTDDLAKAFVSRGAKEFVSWDGSVTAEHTDTAGQALLKNLFAAERDMREAIAETMREVGRDPAFGSSLAIYP
jgi:hypothetical protein